MYLLNGFYAAQWRQILILEKASDDPTLKTADTGVAKAYIFYSGMFHKKNKGILSKINIALYLVVRLYVTINNPECTIFQGGLISGFIRSENG